MDVFTPEKRSQIMSRIGGKNTKPELAVRSILHGLGYRFRLHQKDLPGKPDIVLTKYKTVIFVHGCFWHGHNCRQGSTRPASNVEFWNDKLTKNKKRDAANIKALKKTGWRCLVIWDCQIKNIESLIEKLTAVLSKNGKTSQASIKLMDKGKKGKVRSGTTTG